METIKLKELFEAKAFYNNCLYDLDVNQKNCILDIMQEACNQAIELSLKNSEIEIHPSGCRECGAWGVDENSILKTKSQIENVSFFILKYLFPLITLKAYQ